MSEQERERLEARVTGRVQGVGFRFFTVHAARRLGLTGYVRNRADGSVEAVAEGPRPALLELVAELRQGPPGGRVEHVAFDFRPATQEYAGFEVRQRGPRALESD